MNIRDAVKLFISTEADLLLSHILGKPKEFLYLQPDYKLTADQLNRFKQAVKRRQKGEPLAYIFGYKDFMGLRFKVDKNVLVPRPETEELVQKVFQVCKAYKDKKKLKILDVGTGSGCIAISIALALKETKIKDKKYKIYASDISKPALRIAKSNAKKHQVKIEFIHSNLLEKIGIFPDVIVANLPYLAYEWKNNKEKNARGLKFEPQSALYAKKFGLELYIKLFKQISGLRVLPRKIFLEFDPRQKTDLQKIIKKQQPNSTANFYKDLSGKWRVVEITF